MKLHSKPLVATRVAIAHMNKVLDETPSGAEPGIGQETRSTQ